MLLGALTRRLLILAAVLALPVVGGELLARHLVGRAFANAVRARIGVAAAVSLGSSPILPQLVRGRIDTATVRATGARIGGLPPMSLSATLRDVHMTRLTSLQGAIGSLRVDAGLGAAGVRDLLATPTCMDSLPADQRAALTRRPRVLILAGRIDVLPPSGRSIELRLRPAAAGNVLVFRLSALELSGARAPAGELALVRSRVSCSRALARLPFRMTLVSASARSGTLALAFAATNAAFSAFG